MVKERGFVTVQNPISGVGNKDDSCENEISVNCV